MEPLSMLASGRSFPMPEWRRPTPSPSRSRSWSKSLFAGVLASIKTGERACFHRVSSRIGNKLIRNQFLTVLLHKGWAILAYAPNRIPGREGLGGPHEKLRHDWTGAEKQGPQQNPFHCTRAVGLRSH